MLFRSEQDESMACDGANSKESNVAIVAGCSSELIGVMAQPVEDPPDLDYSAQPRMLIQGMEEHVKADDIVAACNGLERTEEALFVSSVGEVPPLVSSPKLAVPGDPLSLQTFEPDKPPGGGGGVTSPTLLDEFLSSFSH